MEINDCFDNKGNFTLKYFDPYRREDTPEYLLFYDTLFEVVCGQVFLREDVENFLLSRVSDKMNSYDWDCDMIKLLHYREFASNTKGHYPIIYGWR